MRLALALIAGYAWAQTSATAPVPAPSSKAPPIAAKKKAPATPKELAADLLNSAFETAGTASAEAQPYLMWRIADVFMAIDTKKALEALNQAFSDAAILGPNSASLESAVAQSTAEIDLARAIEMVRTISVPRGSYDPRNGAMSQIVGQLIAKNRIDGAIELINLVSGNGPYPYQAVGSILAAVPNEDDPRRLLAFSGALAGYQAHPDAGFGRFLANHWEKLPRPTVTHALDVIVETVSAYKDEDSQLVFTFIGAKGSATLSTDRDAQLFDILAPLQACEPEKLSDLFDKYPEFKKAADLFPNGNDRKDVTGGSIGLRNAGSAGTQSNSADDFIANSRLVSQAVAAAAKDLSAGVELANNIPNSAYRGEALLQIARARAQSDPSTAHDLIERAIRVLISTPDGPVLDGVSQSLLSAFETARKLKDDDLAREILDHVREVAARLYKIDSDSDDPNTAPVDLWPSLHIYREAMRDAVLIDRMKSPARLQQIRSPDVFLLCQVAIAAALLDRRQEYSWSVQHKTKN